MAGCPSWADSALEADYEQLRRENLVGHGKRFGLAAFLRYGMVGWAKLRAHKLASTPPIQVQKTERAEDLLLRGDARDIVTLLSEMIVDRMEPTG